MLISRLFVSRADPLAAGVVVDLINPARGIRTSLWDSPMPTSNRSSPSFSARVSGNFRTAVYGPVRTVVWEGRSREAPLIPIFGHHVVSTIWPMSAAVEPDMTAGLDKQSQREQNAPSSYRRVRALRHRCDL